MRKVLWIILIALAVAGAGLGAAVVWAEPTRETLDVDIKSVDEEIAAAQKEAVQYNGGLIAQQIQLRLETLKTTRAMLDQKRLALLRLIDLSYVVEGKTVAPAVPSDLEQMQVDMKRIGDKLSQDEAELAGYSGGLVQVMMLVTVATEKSTLALMEMRYLTAKWGILLTVPQISASGGGEPDSGNPGTVVKDKDAL
jgi:hypothetical protein